MPTVLATRYHQDKFQAAVMKVEKEDRRHKKYRKDKPILHKNVIATVQDKSAKQIVSQKFDESVNNQMHTDNTIEVTSDSQSPIQTVDSQPDKVDFQDIHHETSNRNKRIRHLKHIRCQCAPVCLILSPLALLILGVGIAAMIIALINIPKTTITTTISPMTTTITSMTTTTITLTTTTTITSTTITTTTDTTTTSGCGSTCQNTLLLSDTNTATVQTLVNSLQSAGLTVNYISGGITTYTGSPAASSYSLIILITGTLYGTDMPTSGQQSIIDAQQNNGTGVIITEWGAYQVSLGRWSTLSPLFLASRVTGVTGSMSYTLVNSGHPIWNGLAASFTTSVSFQYSTLGTPHNGSIIVANCTVCGTAAVMVRPSSGTTGRIVQLAHAGHYSTSGFNWGNDANVVTMMINAVKWAAQII